ncbi:MAG: B12-binding domain-containing radical SAM protein [Proteobacteria bacterium]|nr:B12-binding domain-containing radical SAM protein [Pseudomonadota bacterium]MBU4294731.1 B12-binding domain-containing radical SAM protein [Pseudomonadota bacterium]MCG2746285.1 B12-binding domain-containing radical SAM protein [Desulfobulbaceae bacterium]
MKNILLVCPPNPFLENQCSVPRLGLLYLGTMLNQHGHNVVVRHLRNLNELEGLVEESFDLVGISATTREYMDAIQILNYFKREGSRATMVLGGPHATALPTEGLRNGFDVVVTGEADEEIVKLVNHPPELPAIIHAGLVQDVDSLPFPERSLMCNNESWRPFLCLGQNPNLRTASILLSRGCLHRCTFCGPHFRYRRRSDDNIATEVRMLHKQGYHGIIIVDDLPFISEQQVRSFCEIIRPLGMSFRCNFRPDLLTRKIAMLLAESGCCRIQFGIESANQMILDTIKKGTYFDKNGRAIEICRAQGLLSKAMFIWGLPGDGPETALQIVDWVTRFQPDSIQVSRFVPLPGSPVWLGGYHRRVADYSSLSFFRNPNFKTKIGVANDRLSPEDLDTLHEEILSECSRVTHIDKGLPPIAKDG